MIKLYATIRKQSEYANQQELNDKGKPIPFPVVLDFDNPFFPVKGGIGGQYALFDVELYAVNTAENNELVKLPVHKHIYAPHSFLPAKRGE